MTAAEHTPSRTGYVRGCRCESCTVANADYTRQWRWQTGRNAPFRASEHGSTWRYQTGCRCDECRAANARAVRLYRARRKAASA